MGIQEDQNGQEAVGFAWFCLPKTVRPLFISTYSYSVGRLIVTRDPLGHRRESIICDGAMDITLEYKNTEGTLSERMSVLNAVKDHEKAAMAYTVQDEDVRIKLIEMEKVKYGEPFKVRVILEVRANNT